MRNPDHGERHIKEIEDETTELPRLDHADGTISSGGELPELEN